MTHQKEHAPFYDKVIYRHEQQDYIREILKKYRHSAANEDLKKKIWEELMMEKHLGRIDIPFQVVLRKSSNEAFPDVVEVILDTRV